MDRTLRHHKLHGARDVKDYLQKNDVMKKYSQKIDYESK